LKINFGTLTGNTSSESGFTGYISSAFSSNLWIKTMQKYNTHHHVSLIFDKNLMVVMTMTPICKWCYVSMMLALRFQLIKN